MSSRDAMLIQGNIAQSAMITLLAGGILTVFQPNAATLMRLGQGLVAGCGKRLVNGLAIYGCCSMMDYIRRGGKGLGGFWFLKNKIGSEASADEYFMSSSFRFVTFAASSGASCVTNFITRNIGLYGSRKPTTPIEGSVAEYDVVEKQPTGLTGVVSRMIQFYDTENALKPYTNLARALAQCAIYGISSVAMGAGLCPFTFGPIDNDTHVRVLSKCGPAEIAYWSTITALSTVTAETVYNGLFFVASLGDEAIANFQNEDGKTLGFAIVSGFLIGIIAAALNGATIFVVSNRAVNLLGDDGEKENDGVLHTVAKVMHEKVFVKFIDRRKGVSYIWARTIGYIGHVISA